MRELARLRGGDCLATTFEGVQVHHWWRCKKGHEWKTTPHNIGRGTWCPFCGGRAPGSIAKMRKLAAARGGRCNSTVYVNARTKLTWQCAKGHRWTAIPDGIARGSWCPECAGNTRKSITDMQLIAVARGGKCLSNTYYNNDRHLVWECAVGHEWKALPMHVARGSWCPRCQRGRKRPVGKERASGRAPRGKAPVPAQLSPHQQRTAIRHAHVRLRTLGWESLKYRGPGRHHPLYTTFQFEGVAPFTPGQLSTWTVGIGTADAGEFVILPAPAS